MEGGCFQNQVFLLVEQWWVPINSLIIILIMIILIGGRVESLNNLKCEQFMAMFRSSLPIIVRQYPLNHTKLSFFTASGWCFGFLSWSCRIWCQREPIKNPRLCLFFTFQNLFSQHFAFLAIFREKEVFSQVVQVFLGNLFRFSLKISQLVQVFLGGTATQEILRTYQWRLHPEINVA